MIEVIIFVLTRKLNAQLEEKTAVLVREAEEIMVLADTSACLL